MSRRDFVSLPVDDGGEGATYDKLKTRRIRLWRWWKQKSRFQRIVLGLMSGLMITVAFYMILNWNTVNTLRNSVSFSETNFLAKNEVQMKKPDHEPVVEKKSLFGNNDESNDVEQIPDPNGKIKEEQAQQQLFEVPIENEDLEENRKMISKFTGPTNNRQKAVVEAFLHSWNAYKKYAWGHDHLKPISKSFNDWFGLGLTIVDSIDTIIIMRLKQEYQEARKFISDVLNFDINKDVNLFEVTIRVLGGLLSAFHLTDDQLYLNKAIDLGDKLLPSFNSPSGIPYSDVNLRSHRPHPPKWGPDSSVSEVSTIQLEFKDLSRLTGDPKYELASDKVSRHLHDQPKHEGLVPMFINAESGKFRSYSTITLGARGDSYYEYLLKQWIHTGKTNNVLLKDYNESVTGMLNNLLKYSEPHKLAFMGELTNGKLFKPKMDHLVCYLPAVLILGYKNGLPETHFKLAQDLMYTCYQMYAQMPTFLSPEIVHFNVNPAADNDLFVKVADSHNLLRPEAIESLWYMYHFTRNKTYQDWGWEIFQAFEKYTKVADGGYTSIDNVRNPNDPQPKDVMESFWLSETLKYFYLLFSDDQEILSLNKWVFNTEAHPLRILT